MTFGAQLIDPAQKMGHERARESKIRLGRSRWIRVKDTIASDGDGVRRTQRWGTLVLEELCQGSAYRGIEKEKEN